MARLEGKTAVITGGAGGIGTAAGKLFAQEGAEVLLVDLDEEALGKVAASIGSGRASHVVADVTQPEQVAEYVRVAVQRYGGIDVFLNNAGIEGEVKPITDYDIETFDRVIAVNVRGVWLGLKYVIPEMVKRGGGSIVITSSISGVSGSAGSSAYITSKHAEVGLMRAAAMECSPWGIRVNTVNPAPTETRMMRSLEEQYFPGAASTAKQGILDAIPLKRYATPEEVAQLMLFLASDESQYCTGGIYMVDGGMSAAVR